MSVFVRAAALTGYQPLAQSLGLDVPALLARFELPLAALHEPDRLISYPAFINLLEESAVLGHCADFGLRLAHVQGIGILGPIAVLLRQARHVSEAIELGVRYLFVHSPALSLQLQADAEQPDRINLQLDIRQVNLAARLQITSLSLSIICQCLRQLTADRVQPLQVSLPQAQPADLAVYQRAYGCAVRFMAASASVQLLASDLEVVLGEQDPQIKQLALDYLQRYAGPSATRLSEQVRRLAGELLGSGLATQEAIARSLALHPRTLQRRLRAEGTSFAELLDNVRQEQFKALIALPGGPSLTQIAHFLGYAEASVLSRSCTRWFGSSPRAMRALRVQ
ncbi:AraC family transcriptional regulator ligand-binding domain-containing protein [Pseudomonas sp. NY15354]|uniref:AraC family transcriptional regulator n=1 Tax=Pseudomonas sp. NY15354 TaxID=3400351 RepID=UPI003A8B61D3